MENVKKLVLINKSDLESNIDLSSISEYPVVFGNTVSKDGLAVSIKFNLIPDKDITPSTISLVVPATFVTIAFSSSNRWFNILLFPTLGRIINGMRLADRGEFSKRAYLNGRIDLVEVGHYTLL